MNLLFYSTMENGAGARLQGVIEEIAPQDKIEIHRTIASLSPRLRRPANDVSIALFLAASREDLAEILSIRGLLSDVRTILILPDREKDTIAKGHSFRPRFISYIDSDFTDVAAVLSKMV
jgi:hypothetical protein